MAEPVELPQMGPAQQQSWLALLDLYEKVNSEWTLIGGQLVHLHCAERGGSPARPTNDADTVVDIRASPQMLARFTGAMQELGFTPETSGDGIQHRWRRDLAQIDVLIPEGVGERAAARVGAGGAPTISAPGTTQALRRSESLADGDCPEAKPCRCSHRQGRRSDRDRRRPSSVSALCRLRGVGTPRFGSRLPSRRPDEEGPVAAPPNDRLLPQGLFRFGGGRRY